jgi:putative transposase
MYCNLPVGQQLKPRQKTKPAKHHKPKACTAHGPNEVWTRDTSYFPTTIVGQYYYAYVIIDMFSRKFIGWSTHKKESVELSAGLIKQVCFDEEAEQNQLVLHSDNGQPMKGMTLPVMLETLGVMPSFSRSSVSDDNPYSESLFKTVNTRYWLLPESVILNPNRKLTVKNHREQNKMRIAA